MKKLKIRKGPDQDQDRQRKTSHSPSPPGATKESIVRCHLCEEPTRVKVHNMADHKMLEHSNALFRCTLCDDKEASRFEMFSQVFDHVKAVHKVSEEAVNKVIKLPYVEALRAYQCGLCGETFVGMTEEKVAKRHFMPVHNAKKVKASQMRRTCRVCGFQAAKSDADLVKHINEEHPSSEFADDDSEDDFVIGGDDDNERDEVGAVSAPNSAAVLPGSYNNLSQANKPLLFPAAFSTSGEVESSSLLEPNLAPVMHPGLNFILPLPTPSKWEREEEEEEGPAVEQQPKSTTKKGKTSATKQKKRKLKKSGQSDDSSESESSYSSSSSADSSKKKGKKTKKKKLKKKKRRRYRKPSESSDSEATQEDLKRLLEAKEILEAEILKASGVALPPEDSVSHQVHQKTSKRSPSRSRSSRSFERNLIVVDKLDISRSKSHSRSRSRTPPRASSPEHYCSDCQGYFTDRSAYNHFKSSTHRDSVRNKVRCFLCCLHVSDLKAHFERFHCKDVFQCQMPKCSNPKFLDIMKVVKHIRDKHFSVPFNRTDDLIRDRQISIPQNLSSHRCKRCNHLFLGQSLERVLDHQKWHDGVRHPREEDVEMHCRVCGPRRLFDDDASLQRHVKTHVPDMVWSPSPPPRRRNKDKAYCSRSRSRSTSPQPHALIREETLPTSVVGGRKRRDYAPCLFCPCVTENFDNDKMNHYTSEHEQHLFRCRLCQGKFASATRFGVFSHLRKMHRKDESDENLTRRHVILPMDIRRVYCHTCYQNEENFEWCCQKLRDLEQVLVEHRDRKHTGAESVGDVIRLGCRACDAFYAYGDFNARKDWHNHVRFGHRGSSVDECGGGGGAGDHPDNEIGSGWRQRNGGPSYR